MVIVGLPGLRASLLPAGCNPGCPLNVVVALSTYEEPLHRAQREALLNGFHRAGLPAIVNAQAGLEPQDYAGSKLRGGAFASLAPAKP